MRSLKEVAPGILDTLAVFASRAYAKEEMTLDDFNNFAKLIRLAKGIVEEKVKVAEKQEKKVAKVKQPVEA